MVGFLGRKCRQIGPREGWKRHPPIFIGDIADDPTPIFYRGRAQKKFKWGISMCQDIGL